MPLVFVAAGRVSTTSMRWSPCVTVKRLLRENRDSASTVNVIVGTAGKDQATLRLMTTGEVRCQTDEIASWPPRFAPRRLWCMLALLFWSLSHAPPGRRLVVRIFHPLVVGRPIRIRRVDRMLSLAVLMQPTIGVPYPEWEAMFSDRGKPVGPRLVLPKLADFRPSRTMSYQSTSACHTPPCLLKRTVQRTAVIGRLFLGRFAN